MGKGEPMAHSAKSEPRRGIQSVEIGVSILRVIRDATASLQLKDIAQQAGMAPSKAHRYLVSYNKCGLTRQDAISGRYELGPFCLEVGLAMLGRMDEIDLVWGGLTQATEQLGVDAHVSVWSVRGPIVARWKQGPGDISIRVREGSVLPILTSATGRVWASHLPRHETKDLIARELAALTHSAPNRAEEMKKTYVARIEEARTLGLACAEHEVRQGVSALAGPILNAQGIAYGMTLIAQAGEFDLGFEMATARTFKAILDGLSVRLGHIPPSGAPPA